MSASREGKRRVLFMAYDFPPGGARGTKRIVKFLKYLPDFGWEPIVLTARNPNYDFHDGSLLSELPAVLEVHKARTLESLIYSHRYGAGDVADALAVKLAQERRGVLRKLAVTAYHAMGEAFGFVDSRILWLPFAVLRGIWLVQKRKIRIVFASGPSFTNHLAAMLVCLLSRAHLVVDFRDAWASNPAEKPKKRLHNKIVCRMEQAVVSIADVIVSTTEGITADFLNRYRTKNGKFRTITNGYDPSDFRDLTTRRNLSGPGRFVVLHAGTLGGERSPKEFLAAVGMMAAELEDLPSGMRVVFVGQNNRFADGKTIKEYLQDFGLREIVNITGYVSRKESLEMMADADLLLAIIGSVPPLERHIYGIPHKLYDYAAAGREVMTIADEGASTEMARRLGFSCIISPRDVGAIERALREYYDEYKRQGFVTSRVNAEFLARFDFRSLTGTLANIFGEITSRTSRPDAVYGRARSLFRGGRAT